MGLLSGWKKISQCNLFELTKIELVFVRAGNYRTSCSVCERRGSEASCLFSRFRFQRSKNNLYRHCGVIFLIIGG